MLISLNWLKQYVDLPTDITPSALALKLTMSTVEVESVSTMGGNLDGVVVGELLEIKKHPNADKLSIAQVNVGEAKPRQIVFGQMVEMKVGYKVPVALAPTILPGGHKIEKAKLRGETSEGMLCLDQELGLLKEGVSIHFFDKDVKNGSLVKEVLHLDDTVLEIDNKSLTNRPDLWGHYGIAREIAAIYDLQLKKYATKAIKGAKTVDLKVKIEDKILCPRYLAVALTGIKVEESPAWLKQYLQAIGQKPINNIVDVTNYIMFDIGQPLHAFDATKVASASGGKDAEIIVRRAKDKEKTTTLDGVSRSLTAEDLVIADRDKAVALAGVMGGVNSEISDQTETIIIESANFAPVGIRRTANRLSCRTEASMRFEKSLDPNFAQQGIEKAVELILKMCQTAKVASALIDESHFKLNQEPISLSWEFIDARIGMKIERDGIVKILSNLGFKVKKNKTGVQVVAPTWRATKDISIAEDIIEEITRVFGYDNLAPEMPLSRIEYIEPDKILSLIRETRNILSEAISANEIYNYSFVEKEILEKSGDAGKHIEIANPFAENVALLRTSLIPGLLKNAVDNSRFYNQFNLYEIGRTFINDKKGEIARPNTEFHLPTQDIMVAGLFVGKNNEDAFFRTKGIVETLFEKLNIAFQYEKASGLNGWMHPEQSLLVLIDGEAVGYVSSLHPQVASSLEIKSAIAIWELNLNKIVAHYPNIKKYEQLPKYPAMKLDLSVILNEETPWKDVQALVKVIDPIIKRCELLDVFKGGTIKAGEKSLTFRITYQAEERTLEMEEVNKLQNKVIEQLSKMGALVRK